MSVLLKCLFGLAFLIIYVKSISTSNCSYTQVDDISVDSDNTSSSTMPPNLLEPMEQQHFHFPLDVPSRLRPVLARFQAVHKAICGFVPPAFTSPCFFLRLVMDYLLCTLLCWILSSICALASGSACTEIHRVKDSDVIIPVDISLNEHVCFLILFMFGYLYISSTFLNYPLKTSLLCLHRWILRNPSRYVFIIALLFLHFVPYFYLGT